MRVSVALSVLLLVPVAASARAADTPAAATNAAPAQASSPATPSLTPDNPPVSDSASVTTAPNDIRLHDLERRVDELKEEVFRSKARLNLLKETVLHGVIAGARAVVMQVNDMGSLYRPISYVYALDGTEIFSRSDDSGKLGEQKQIEIFNGSITPGNHTLSVEMVYQGNGYGVFSYLKGYKFITRSSHTFTAAEGKQLQLKVVGFEKGNALTTDPKDRPSIDFRETVLADKDVTDAAASPPAKKN